MIYITRVLQVKRFTELDTILSLESNYTFLLFKVESNSVRKTSEKSSKISLTHYRINTFYNTYGVITVGIPNNYHS